MSFLPVNPSGAPADPAPEGNATSPARPLVGVIPLLTSHLVVALIALVGIGGATRVLQAGLACPDWPLCYGVLFPGRQMNLQVFLEWFHRLDAFLVGLFLLVLFALALLRRTLLPRWLPWAAGAALLLVILQGALGALTVTGLLAAPTVTAHLTTALLLVLLASGTHQGVAAALAPGGSVRPPLWWLVLTAVTGLLLLGQCLLGGSLASQWAAERCLQSGEDCHWLLLHRLGARAALAALLALAGSSLLLPRGHRQLRSLVATALALMGIQIGLGVLTLRLQLATPAVTVAHQLVAALLVGLIGALLGLSLAAPDRHPDPVPASSLEVIHG